jgi:hypothetical protein
MEITTADIARTINLVRFVLFIVLACRSIFLCLLDFILLPLAGANIHHVYLIDKIRISLN